MSTGYKLATHNPTGEVYALAWANDGDGEYILGVAGPLHYTEAAALVGREYDCDFDDGDDLTWAEAQTWDAYTPAAT